MSGSPPPPDDGMDFPTPYERIAKALERIADALVKQDRWEEMPPAPERILPPRTDR